MDALSGRFHFSLLLMAGILVFSAFLPISARGSSPTEGNGVAAVFSTASYIDIGNISKLLASAITSVAGFVNSHWDSGFLPVDYQDLTNIGVSPQLLSLASSFVGFTAGYNFTLTDQYNLNFTLNGTRYHPGDNSSVVISATTEDYATGYLLMEGGINYSLTIPTCLTAGCTSKPLTLYEGGYNAEMLRTFFPGIGVNASVIPSTPGPFLPSCGTIYLPLSNGPPYFCGAEFRISQYDVPQYLGILCYVTCAEHYDFGSRITLYRIVLDVVPTVFIDGSLSGSLESEGVSSSFSTTSATTVGFSVPKGNSLNSEVPIYINDIQYSWSPTVILRAYVAGQVINPLAFRTPFLNVSSDQPLYFSERVHVADIPIHLKPQLTTAPNLRVLTPASYMDSNPFVTDNLRIALIGLAAASGITIVIARRRE
jgi:hypothetical protein